MNYLEFKRRLMTDPTDPDPEFRAARRRDGDFAAAAAESDAFERSLRDAVEVEVPDKLAEDIILEQSVNAPVPRRARVRHLAVAASLVLAVALGAFYGSTIFRDGPMDADSLQQHLAWHWEMDGAVLHTASGGVGDAGEVRRILSEFGVHAGPGLLENTRVSKFCPTPDGSGAHLVLETEQGPVTVFYMPKTRVPEAMAPITLGNGLEGRAFNVARGSVAVVAEPGQNTPELAAEIQRQLAFPPTVRL